MRRLLLLASLFLFAFQPGFSQTPQTGLYEFGAYDTPGFDTINRGNLNVHLSIPIFSRPGRAGTNFSFTLNYDSLVWTPAAVSGVSTWQPAANWGWTTVSNAEFGYVSYTTYIDTCALNTSPQTYGTETEYFWYYYHDQHGQSHPFPYAYVGPCNGAPNPTGSRTLSTSDNSGYTVYVNGTAFTIFTNTGEQFSVPSFPTYYGNPPTTPTPSGVSTDTNGNQISVSSSGVFTDTLGNTALTVSGSGTPSSPMVYTYKDTTGTFRSVTVYYTAYNVTTKFGMSGVTEYGGTSIPLVSSIVYPDGSRYSFTYENTPGSTTTYTGRLASITLPTGGQISYAYTGGSNGIEPDGSTSGLSRTTSDGTTSYARTGVSSTASTTTYTDAHSPPNTTVSTYLEDTQGYIYETSRAVYQGAASGTPIQQVTTCYAQVSGCPANSVTAPIGYVTTTLAQNGVQVASDTKQYSGGFLGSDNNGYITETTLYKPFTGINGIGFSRVSSVTDVMGSTQIALTTYSYDETTGAGHAALAAPPSGILQHGGAVPALRGNLTTVARWVNTTSSTLSAEAAYDTTGQMVSSMDPRGNITTYGYDPGTDAFLTLVTYPTPSSGVAVTTSATYDYTNTGLLLTSTDANKAKTSYSYNKMLQPTGISVATIGGTVVANTGYNYSGSALPETITATVTATPSPNQVTTTTLDGLGRALTVLGPNGATSKVSYDAMGRVFQTYNPYFTLSDSTYGYSTYGYDAAGRTVLKTQPDGTTQSWSYNGKTATFTNEVGSQWQQSFDGMGRLTKVLEPSPTAKTPTIETDYTYGGFTTTINQKGVSGETARVRTFTSDSLGRMISEQTPEAGAVCYGTWSGGAVGSGNCQNGYDANGNLLAKTDARNITVNYAYDALNRLTTKTVPGMSYGYAYDNTTGSSYGIGRLYSDTNNVNVGNGYYYDAMGRLKATSFQTPSISAYQGGFAAVYDMAGDITSLTYPDGRVVTQAWSAAGQLNSETDASYNGQAINYNYLSSATYFAGGAPQTMNFGNGTAQTISGNSRMQTSEIALQMNAAGLSRQIMNKWFCYGPVTSEYCANYGVVNNGNIMAVNDSLNSANLQGFTYDNLNRITGFGTGNQSINQGYAYDSFGNMNQNAGTFQTNYSFNANNRIYDTGFTYDAAGNLTQANLGGGTYQYMAYNADSKLINFNNGAALYTYDAVGNRVRKDVRSSWMEYVYFNGQPLAEKNVDGTWSDYIFANGQRIARGNAVQPLWHTHGVRDSSINMACGTVWNVSGTPPGFSGYTIRSGDVLAYDQLQSVAHAGAQLEYTDGSFTEVDSEPVDQQGYPIGDSLASDGMWHHRVFTLAGSVGKTVQEVATATEADTPAGTWDVWYQNMSIVSTDGTVTPVFVGQPLTGSIWSNCGGYDLSFGTESTAVSAPQDTTYYQGDHLGSARLLTASGGWPISSETYYPFGLEQSAPSDPNHYKFTGLERDSESGLDHTAFRQYANLQGRWLAPDPYDGSYDLTNPQSLNRYAYVFNNPLSFLDPSGLAPQLYCYPTDLSSSQTNSFGFNSSNTINYGTSDDDSTIGNVSTNNSVVCYFYDTATGTSSAVGSGSGSGGSAPSNLPKPTIFKVTIPGTNYCGPGGNGTPTTRVDGQCAQHDKCEENANSGFINNVTGTGNQGAIQACNAQLCSGINNIPWPTSVEMGQATLVATYFNCGGYSLR